MQSNNKYLFFDILAVFAGILLAIFLARSELLGKFLEMTERFEILSSFIAGIFFTSIFTVAPATVTLGKIAISGSVLKTSIFGAMGAVFGDLIIFKFVRDNISEYLEKNIKNEILSKSFRELFKYKLFRWTLFLISGLIISSPLPDELGVSLLGFLKIKTRWFIYISFVFNFIGVLIVALLAKSL